jgi:hypothetical protein
VSRFLRVHNHLHGASEDVEYAGYQGIGEKHAQIDILVS